MVMVVLHQILRSMFIIELKLKNTGGYQKLKT